MSTLTVPVNAGDHMQGSNDAPVTPAQYGDYECPYCGEAYPIVKRLQKKMGGDLRFVFRNFPVTESHPTRSPPRKRRKQPPYRVSSGKCTTCCMKTSTHWRTGI